MQYFVLVAEVLNDGLSGFAKMLNGKKFPQNVRAMRIIVSRVYTFNFLGLQIVDNLKWNTHIDHISKKNVSHNSLTQSNENDIPTRNFTLHL